MEARRQTLFEGETFQIGAFEMRPSSDACGEVESQSQNVIVLPVSGVFAKHDRPGHRILGTPSHGVLVAAETPYRLNFPGAIGDRALLLRFDKSLAPELLDAAWTRCSMASSGLLPAKAMVLRNLLWKRLPSGETDDLEAEALGLELLGMSLVAMQGEHERPMHSTIERRGRSIERVREAVATAPAEKWSIAKLARIANQSPFHLCHVFRDMTGISVYDYVVRERLAQTLDFVFDGADLTSVALDAGFASHSHFTSRFKTFFGCTPTDLRRLASTERLTELRKIVTASHETIA